MNFIIALLAGLGAGTWLYTKFMRRSGNNTKNSALTAGLLAFFVFIVVLTIAYTVDSALK